MHRPCLSSINVIFIKSCIVFVLSLSPCSYVQGLRCYQCSNAKHNKECRQTVTCSWGSLGCENEIRLRNNELFISKHCKQYSACKINLKNNFGQCNPRTLLKAARQAVHLEKTNSASLCRSCCNKNLCNGRPFIEDSVSKEKTVGFDRHRMLLPPVADVESTLTSPTSALVTFTDPSDDPGSTYYITLTPSAGVKVNAIKRSEIPNIVFNNTIPKNIIAYVATGLSGGTRYRINIIKKVGFARYGQGVFDTFVTPPPPVGGLKLVEVNTDSVLISVGAPQQPKSYKYNSIRVSYRKSNDSENQEKFFPPFSVFQVIRLSDLDPAAEYTVSAWTSINGPEGYPELNSTLVRLIFSTKVPPVTTTVLRHHHATNLTWVFTSFHGAYQKEFVVTVRDDTDELIVVKDTLRGHQHSFTASNLIPEHYYSLGITVKSGNLYSESVKHDPVRTVTRCYGCLDASSREQCMEIIECEPKARGCLVELRSRSYGLNRFSRRSFRATMRCKQVAACDKQEDQNISTQCDPAERKHNSNPPEVCRCCCEGDLCDGPGTDCGRLLGWLKPLASPIMTTPSYAITCKELSLIRDGFISCTEGERTVGTICNFSCGAGTYLLGISKAECLPGGTWSHRNPKCIPAKRCPVIESTFRMYAACTKHNTPFSKCRINCRPGFTRFGKASVACRPTGKWTIGRGTCVERDECKPNPCVNNGRCVDAINSFECFCSAGFYGELCERERTCELLEQPLSGTLECTNSNKLGSSCRYSCDPGHAMHGVKYTRCNKKGMWTGGDPTMCVVNICKVIPTTLINGGRASCTGYSYNDTCRFTCPENLKIAGGSRYITCKENSEWSGEIPCCDLPCPPYAKVDVILVLDSSSSVGRSSWRELIKFTIALLDHFVIGKRDMRVGVLRYNRKVDKKSEIELGDYKNAQDLKAKIKRIPYNGWGTKTGRALQHVYSHSIKVTGNRPEVLDVVVVITDGLASDSVGPPAQALHAIGTKIYVVGVINKRAIVNIRQLEKIASGPKYLQIIDEGYAALAEKLSQKMITDVCWVPCKFQYERRELSERQRFAESWRISEEERKYWERSDREQGSRTEKKTLSRREDQEAIPKA